MYVGRIVAIGRTGAGSLCAMYRVSSRSFPNRRAHAGEEAVSIIPKEGYEADIQRNPYIAYNCLRLVGPYAVATNGAQTDPVTEKLAAGMSMRDGMVTALFGMDYEHDQLNTPRIAAVVKSGSNRGCLGIVRHDALLVREFELDKNELFYLCTYEHNAPLDEYCDDAFDVSSAAEACRYILGKGVFADKEKPISAACAVETGKDTFEVAAEDVS